MKRLLLIVLCLLIFPWTPCQSAEPIQLARMNPWVAGSAKSCSTDSVVLFDSLSNTRDDYMPVGVSSGYYWAGQKNVQFSFETVICEVTYYLRSVAGTPPPVDIYSEVATMSGTSWGTYSPSSCRSAAYSMPDAAGTHTFSHGDDCVVPANTNIGFAVTSLKDTGIPYPTIYMSSNMTPTVSSSVVGNAADWNTNKTIDDNRTTYIMVMQIKGYIK